jgi:branched-chain amino acid aminotransferase
METPRCWNIAANGALVQPSSLHTMPAHDRGLLLGDGVFDTLRVENGQAFFALQHLTRLQHAAQVLQLPCVTTMAHIMQAAQQLGQGTLRLNISRGMAPRGLLPPPQPQAQTWLLGYNTLPARNVSLDMASLSTIRRNDTSPLSGIKSLCQLEQVLALQQAIGQGADEALLANTRGFLTCASAGNIIYTLHGHGGLFTPPLHDGVLAGITRARLLPYLIEKSLHMNDLAQVSGMVTINTLRGVCAVHAIAGVGVLPASVALADYLMANMPQNA